MLAPSSLAAGSGRFKIAALTNNFATAPPSRSEKRRQSTRLPSEAVSAEAIHASLREAAKDHDMQGAGSELLKSMFDEFIESSEEGLR